MKLCLIVTTTLVVATAVLFAPSSAVPIPRESYILSNVFSNPVQNQQDSVPDPGIGDWFTTVFNTLTNKIAKNLKDGDPKKIEAVRSYVKNVRSFIAPISTFVKQFYSDDVAAGNIMKAINSFLSSLDKLVEEPSASDKVDLESLAKVMRMLQEATKS